MLKRVRNYIVVLVAVVGSTLCAQGERPVFRVYDVEERGIIEDIRWAVDWYINPRALASLAALINPIETRAYISEQPQEKFPVVLTESAILIDEMGVARCIIGRHPGGYSNEKHLVDLYQNEFSIDPDTLNSLRECDGDDVLYARIVLDGEGPTYSLLLPPALRVLGSVRALGSVASLRAAIGCLGGFIGRTLRSIAHNTVFDFGMTLMWGGLVGVPWASVAWSTSVPAVGAVVVVSAPVLFLFTVGTGFVTCG